MKNAREAGNFIKIQSSMAVTFIKIIGAEPNETRRVIHLDGFFLPKKFQYVQAFRKKSGKLLMD